MNSKKRPIIEKIVIVFLLTYGMNTFANEFRPSYFRAVMSLNIDEGLIRCLMYMGHWPFLVVFALYAWAVQGDRKYVFSFLDGKPSRNIRYALLGAASGLALMSVCVIAAAIHGDLTISRATTMTAPIAVFALFANIFLAAVEEIKFRGWLAALGYLWFTSSM